MYHLRLGDQTAATKIRRFYAAFEEVDAVREERHRPDQAGDGELDAEVREIQDRDQQHRPAQGGGLALLASLRCAITSWSHPTPR